MPNDPTPTRAKIEALADEMRDQRMLHHERHAKAERMLRVFMSDWKCPFCGSVHAVASEKAIAEWLAYKNCPACDYHNPFIVGPRWFIEKYCEPI